MLLLDKCSTTELHLHAQIWTLNWGSQRHFLRCWLWVLACTQESPGELCWSHFSDTLGQVHRNYRVGAGISSVFKPHQKDVSHRQIWKTCSGFGKYSNSSEDLLFIDSDRQLGLFKGESYFSFEWLVSSNLLSCLWSFLCCFEEVSHLGGQMPSSSRQPFLSYFPSGLRFPFVFST